MRRTRIYHADEININVEITLDANAAQHVRDVLRMQVGNAIILFNGDGCDYLGTIVRVSKKNVSVMLHASEKRSTVSPLHLHLAQGICRGEKMDFVVQKATELGVNEITPLISEYCNVKLSEERLQKKVAHWRKVVVNACEQCGRTDLLTLNPVMQINQWLQRDLLGTGYILDPGATYGIIKKNNVSKLTLLIGPEGGFTNSEIQYAVDRGFYHCLLGPRVLRSETASLAAVSMLQHLYGDF